MDKNDKNNEPLKVRQTETETYRFQMSKKLQIVIKLRRKRANGG